MVYSYNFSFFVKGYKHQVVDIEMPATSKKQAISRIKYKISQEFHYKISDISIVEELISEIPDEKDLPDKPADGLDYALTDAGNWEEEIN